MPNKITASINRQKGLIWFDGTFVNWENANLHVLSQGLHYGTTVWEGIRSYNGRIFKLTEHTQRLLQGAKQMGLNILYTKSEIAEACNDIISRQFLNNAYIRPIAWQGAGTLELNAEEIHTHIAITAWELPQRHQQVSHNSALRISIAKFRRPPINASPWMSKTSCIYALGALAKADAKSRGYDDALILDSENNLAETTSANIFLVKDNTLHTPTPSCFLNGITRQTIIELACELGFLVEERTIHPQELAQADEVFITGTAAEITPISEIDGHHYDIGPITTQLAQCYMDTVNN